MIQDGKLEGRFSLVLSKSPFRRRRADPAFLSPGTGGFEPLAGLTTSPIENTSSLVFCPIPFSSPATTATGRTRPPSMAATSSRYGDPPSESDY